MKKTAILSLVVSIFFLGACSPKYLSKGVMSNSFNKAKTYKTVVLPPVSSGIDQTGNNSIAELAYKDVVSELSSMSMFSVSGDYRSMRKKANTYKYGAADNTNIDIAAKVAKSAGAEALL